MSLNIYTAVLLLHNYTEY